jgi:hypothetical protein
VLWAQFSELDVLENALRDAAGEPPLPPAFLLRLPDVAREAGLTIERQWDIPVPFEADRERLQLASLWDARAYGVEEGVAREVVLAAAQPFRRPDGAYRFENTFTATLLA